MAFHLFHGSESYLVELAFNRAWAQLTRDLDSDLDCELLDGGASSDEVQVAATSVGFFSPVRVVGVRDWRLLSGTTGRRGKAKPSADDPLEGAATMIAGLPEATTLLLSSSALLPPTHPVVKAVQKRGKVMGFPRLRFAEVPAWVTNRAREQAVEIDRRAIEVLVRRAGEDLALLDSELTKLSIYANGAKVTAGDVEALVPDTAEHQVWDLTDSLLSNPGRAALELDRALAAGEPAGRLSYMLVRHLRLLLAASAAPGGSAGARRLTEAFAGDGRPLSDYSVSKAMTQARGVRTERLESIYRRAAASEAASRRGELDELTALRLVVMEAALTSRSAAGAARAYLEREVVRAAVALRAVALAPARPLALPVPLACALASAAALALASGSAFSAVARATAFMSRDFRRAALLGCRTPFSAARSSDETAAFSMSPASASPASTTRRTRVTLVLIAARTDLFRACLVADVRTRFFADLMFAMGPGSIPIAT